LRRRLFDYIFGRLDVVLTLTEADRADALTHYPERQHLFRTVANPYVTERMLSLAKDGRDGPSRLLSAGRMVRQKRFDLLLRAFASSADPEATLTILGDGPLRSDLQELAFSLRVADRVHMPGHADIVEELRPSNLFVLSSDYEGLPAVLIEAIACNVPVVTTDSFHAAREIFGETRSCAVVPIGDPEALARAIDQCLAQRPDGNLRRMAEPYRVQAAIGAHIEALADGVAAQNRTDTPV
jgi:glycosyltransferase involved in cell wall biosynthesis